MPPAAIPQPQPQCLGDVGSPRSERRRPQKTRLYQVVRDNIETFYAAVEDGFVSAPLPGFVRDELEGYLEAGQPA